MNVKKILLVAKPWRGGLAEYVYSALEDLFPGQVEWVPTRPISMTEQISYRIDKKKWEKRLLDQLACKNRELAFFINYLPLFRGLDYHSGNVLWLTDGPKPAVGDYSAYAKVFLSDLGYIENLKGIVPQERLGGELGFACSPEIHQWSEARTEEKQLCFIGNKDPKRDPYIEALLKAKLSFSVVGNYFLRHPMFWRYPRFFSPSVGNRKMGQIYAKHKLSLNLHAQVVRKGTNMRTFECAAYKIPQLVEYRLGIENYFEPEKEIVTFIDVDELLEKAQKLFADSYYRETIAANAHARVLAEHTYRHRMKSILETL